MKKEKRLVGPPPKLGPCMHEHNAFINLLFVPNPMIVRRMYVLFNK